MTQNGIVLVVSISVFKDEKVLIIKENKPNYSPLCLIYFS